MDRKEVLKSPEYWTAKTQIELYNQAESFMKETGRNKHSWQSISEFPKDMSPSY